MLKKKKKEKSLHWNPNSWKIQLRNDFRPLVDAEEATVVTFSFVPQKPGNSNNVRTIISSMMPVGKEH